MKKVLIITYYFPPAGGPGVQRWLKFVKYLPDFGIQPIVYIPENPTYPIVDENLVDEISDKAIIIRRKIWEPYQLASVFSKNKTKKISSGIIPNQKKQTFLEKLFLWIRGNLFVPDARVFWVKPSVKFLKYYISENDIGTVITSGPPHSLHLIGQQLQNNTVKWIADFRDPWTTIGYHKSLRLSSSAAKKHKEFEKSVLNSADLILVTSKTTRKEFSEITNTPIEVITNGFDVEISGKVTLDEKFSIAHIGSFLSARNPEILWQVLKEIAAENSEFAAKFELKLIGAVSHEILEIIAKYKLSDYVSNLGYVSHHEAVRHQRNSQVLLLIEINSEETKSIIPGKLFEYMVSERPIIAIGPKDSDFAEIIVNTNTGAFFTYDQKSELKKQILSYFAEFRQQKLRSHPVGLQDYSRKNLTERLAKLLKQ